METWKQNGISLLRRLCSCWVLLDEDEDDDWWWPWQWSRQ